VAAFRDQSCALRFASQMIRRGSWLEYVGGMQEVLLLLAPPATVTLTASAAARDRSLYPRAKRE